ncbi:LysE family translocator [Streptomyces sp. B1I3]|uniref:LysE family translocator n=1 Tax=Streptomyces sp. B1I3 TaxID=3042264 RepID=UPI00278A1F71|nr:LysE family translocator [Streptomyces sp. B1I3]MDQ0791796.1 threonine/homoserine/homoserine lactone efflux protein [Streptomyces sp. B1I3]
MMSVDLAGFLGVVLLAYLVPGPDFLVIVRAAARRASLGRAAALGAQSGLCVHMCAAALGLSVIATRSAVAFTVIKLAGAAYLVHLGVRALLNARKQRETAGREHERQDCVPPGREATSGSRRSSFAEGFLTNVLNPKAALFFLSVLPQFIDRGGSTTEQIFLLGTLDVVIGLVYWLVLAGVAARLRPAFDRPTWRRRWEQISGGLFIAIGVGVAVVD